MKSIVCLKQVGVATDEVEFNDSGDSVDEDYLDLALNEWDSFALEERCG